MADLPNISSNDNVISNSNVVADLHSLQLGPTTPEKGKSVAEVETCCICFDDLRVRATVQPCQHSQFHLDCVRKWFKREKKCPLCRGQVTDLQYKGQSRHLTRDHGPESSSRQISNAPRPELQASHIPAVLRDTSSALAIIDHSMDVHFGIDPAAALTGQQNRARLTSAMAMLTHGREEQTQQLSVHNYNAAGSSAPVPPSQQIPAMSASSTQSEVWDRRRSESHEIRRAIMEEIQANSAQAIPTPVITAGQPSNSSAPSVPSRVLQGDSHSVPATPVRNAEEEVTHYGWTLPHNSIFTRIIDDSVDPNWSPGRPAPAGAFVRAHDWYGFDSPLAPRPRGLGFPTSYPCIGNPSAEHCSSIKTSNVCT